MFSFIVAACLSASTPEGMFEVQDRDGTCYHAIGVTQENLWPFGQAWCAEYGDHNNTPYWGSWGPEQGGLCCGANGTFGIGLEW